MALRCRVPISLIGVFLTFLVYSGRGNSVPGTSLTPTVWWTANAANNMVAGSSVTQLTDQSGNGHNAVISGSSAPTLAANAVNGLPALFFGGSNALVSATGATTGDSSHTIFTVVKYTPGLSGGFRCGAAFYSGTASANENSSIGVNPNSGAFWLGGYGQDSSPYTDTNNISLNTGKFLILAKVYDASGPLYTGYLNGKLEVPGMTGASAYNLGGTDAGIGRQFDTDSYWGGEIAEVIMFNSALSGSDLAAVENYLSSKYNIAIVSSFPELTVQMMVSNQVQLSWPAPSPDYELQTGTNPAGPYSYAGLPALVQSTNVVAVDVITGKTKFYRLQQVVGASPISVVSAQSDADGATLQMNPGTLKLQVFAPGIVRVAYSLSNSVPAATNSFAVTALPANGTWPLTITADEVHLDTGELEVRVNRASGAVGFYDTNGLALLTEKPDGGKFLTPAIVNGISTLQSEQQFMIGPSEAFYGLGQHQSGIMNYAYSSVHLQQSNPGESDVPLLVSSQGYGLLWDNPAISDVNVGSGNPQLIPSSQLFTTNQQLGGLNGFYYNGTNFNTFVFSRIDPQIDFNWSTAPPTNTMPLTNYSVEWDGYIQAPEAGTYSISVTSDDGARLWLDGQLLVNDWTSRSAVTHTVRVNWSQGSLHSVKLQYYQNLYDATVQLTWGTPTSTPVLDWTSQSADSINYYFIHGPEPDNVIANYRYLTGNPPLFGRWAWGYWQSKEHYASQQELTNVINRYRSNSIPIDCIIQDWDYWNPGPWGSDQFNPTNYPNVPQLMQMLHSANSHMIISVWAKFDVATDANYLQLSNAGALYPEVMDGIYQYYDPFNPVGRQLYWQQISSELFSLGIDGWWLDASEPELTGNWGEYTNFTTAAGPGAKVFNAYPLMHTAAVYLGHRKDNPAKRAFILTRSAYAGQQRNAAVTWSGDVQTTWQAYEVQVPAGINFSLSGIPYWNTDIGGFFSGIPVNPADPAYAELFTRWFQYGAFCPMFRVHGVTTNSVGKEMWQFPAATENILINYDQLRYHLIPYIYSVSWMVTSQGYSMMRGLVMDFRQDTNVYDIPDQFLFGPALLVNPVMQPGATSRAVYLPAGTTWYDFWTGLTYAGGQTNNAAAPIDTMPLYVRAGSIIPYGPSIQYASQSVDPIELRVYRGADGAFTLYEDENDNYNYEGGAYATIPITWTESTQTLTIGQRSGSFPGMLANRTFNVVWVSSGHGVGVPSTSSPDVSVPYNGQAVSVSPGN